MDRTVLIGLDGATFTVLDPALKEGLMPRLAKLIECGVRAPLCSTPHPLTACAWTSMITGQHPGIHGIFDFVQPEEGPSGINLRLNMSHDIQCETIWSIIDRYGGSTTAINYWGTYPPEQVSGYCLPGFIHWRHLRQSVYPANLYNMLCEIPGFEVRQLSFDMNDELQAIQYLPPEQYSEWIATHIRREDQVFRVARHLLETRPTPFTAVVFDGMDKLQHLCWHLIDPEICSSHTSGIEAGVKEMVQKYFRMVDNFIGQIIDIVGSDTRIFVASDHGFCASTQIFHVNAWLAQEGYLRWLNNAEDHHGLLSGREFKSSLAVIDWKRTAVFGLSPSGNGIYIRRANVTGGIGIRDDTYQIFREELADKLSRVISPLTGRPVVRRIMRREEAFPGDANALAPDLTLVLDDYGFMSTLNSDAVVECRPEAWGTHHPLGIFVASGPGIEKGTILDCQSIVDVAPTLLYSLGIPVPVDMEGMTITQAFTQDYLQSHSVKAGPKSVTRYGDQRNQASRSIVGNADILERLKALGYIEGP